MTNNPLTVVGKFEKVSYRQFLLDAAECMGCNPAYFDSPAMREIYENIKLPVRATTGSAGYDFFNPMVFELVPGATVKIPTGIRVKIEDGWWLSCMPRSSLGFKYRLQLDNTIGVIDGDYYNSANEGHIMASLTYNKTGDDCKPYVCNAGDRFMQGIFIPYGITVDDATTQLRNGGLGSTGMSEVS